MLLQKLKESCNERHLQIRAGDYAKKIMNQCLSLQEYKELIVANYYFHGKIEESLTSFLLDIPELSYTNRLKTPALTKDLRALNLNSVAFDHREGQPNITINSFSEAIGTLYVTEGTAIGGAIIKKNLLKIPSIYTNSHIHFFGCYGKELSPLWKNFATYLGGVKVEEPSTILKAKEVFLFYENCLLYAQSIFALEEGKEMEIEAILN